MMRKILFTLIALILLGTVVFVIDLYFTNGNMQMLASSNPDVRMALEQIGVTAPRWDTLILSAEKEAAIPAPVLWATWSRLEEWPVWSHPLHVSARWVGDAEWKPGSKFEQKLSLGFPVGEVISREEVGSVNKGRRVVWSKNEGGIKSCHIWSFERQPDGTTRVTNTEVFQGRKMGWIRPLVARRWQRMFAASVEGLVQTAQNRTR
ncbi:MAG: SRPBCC family protein [Acidobacteriia bacterium]|nr:SRPBCC family protein [Terriglobia bacterium]